MGKARIEDCEARLVELSESWDNGDPMEAQFNEKVAELRMQVSESGRRRSSPAGLISKTCNWLSSSSTA